MEAAPSSSDGKVLGLGEGGGMGRDVDEFRGPGIEERVLDELQEESADSLPEGLHALVRSANGQLVSQSGRSRGGRLPSAVQEVCLSVHEVHDLFVDIEGAGGVVVPACR